MQNCVVYCIVDFSLLDLAFKYKTIAIYLTRRAFLPRLMSCEVIRSQRSKIRDLV